LEPNQLLDQVAHEVTKCEKCGLHFSRKLAVPGVGPADAQVMFIGEGPGFYENEQGKPFVGPAGHFLDELLAKAGLKRDRVFIGNVVKCRPPGNRDPQPDELAACKPFLETQISAIDPMVIVTLGRFSMAYFIANAKISAIHGRPVWVDGRLIVPMYHPAAALHQPALRDSILGDFSNLPRYLELAKTKEALPVEVTIAPQPVTNQRPDIIKKAESPSLPDDKPEQLSLF
jgi:uracil-DNA glycosylase family 4